MRPIIPLAAIMMMASPALAQTGTPPVAPDSTLTDPVPPAPDLTTPPDGIEPPAETTVPLPTPTPAPTDTETDDDDDAEPDADDPAVPGEADTPPLR